MTSKINENIESQIWKEICERKLSVREICRKYNIGMSIYYRVRKQYSILNKGIKPKNKRRILSQSQSRKIAQTSLAIKEIQRSDIIINGVIDVIAGLKKNVYKIEEVMDKSEKRGKVIGELLKEIGEKFDNVYTAEDYDEYKIKQKALNDLEKAVAISTDFFNTQILILKSADCLRKQFETFLKSEAITKGLSQIKIVINNLIQATNALSEPDYFKYRDLALELNPGLRGLFAEWEQPVE